MEFDLVECMRIVWLEFPYAYSTWNGRHVYIMSGGFMDKMLARHQWYRGAWVEAAKSLVRDK